MIRYRIRIRNRLLQHLYRPRAGSKSRFLSAETLAAFDELDKAVEKKITPLLADFFD